MCKSGFTGGGPIRSTCQVFRRTLFELAIVLYRAADVSGHVSADTRWHLIQSSLPKTDRWGIHSEWRIRLYDSRMETYRRSVSIRLFHREQWGGTALQSGHKLVIHLLSGDQRKEFPCWTGGCGFQSPLHGKGTYCSCVVISAGWGGNNICQKI